MSKRKHRHNVRVRLINVAPPLQRETDEHGSSRQIDPGSDASSEIISPPFDPKELIRVVEESDVLSACIGAMRVNIGGFGFDLIKAKPWEPGSPEAEVADKEKRRIEQFFRFINPEIPFAELRARIRYDLEATGNAYWEVIENSRGEIVGIEPMPAHTMRLTVKDEKIVDGLSWIQDENGDWQEVVYPRRYRRFVQIGEGSGKKRYFKEFGDPRVLNSESGKFDKTLMPADSAHAVIHFKIYSPRSPYGIPRWMGATYEAIGRVKASKVNYLYFDNKAVPPMAILVSGGALSDESVKRIEEHFKNLKGMDSYHSIPIIEAASVSDPDDPGSKGGVKIELKSLSEAMEKEGLFMAYRDKAKTDVRGTFRIPPIFLGFADDYTRATAEASQAVGEEQVFQPERNLEDFIINQHLFPYMGFKYWQFKTRGASLSDDEGMTKLLSSAKENGAITPNETRTIIGPRLGVDLPAMDLESADVPLALADLNPITPDVFVEGNASRSDARHIARSIAAMKTILERELKSDE